MQLIDISILNVFSSPHAQKLEYTMSLGAKSLRGRVSESLGVVACFAELNMLGWFAKTFLQVFEMHKQIIGGIVYFFCNTVYFSAKYQSWGHSDF